MQNSAEYTSNNNVNYEYVERPEHYNFSNISAWDAIDEWGFEPGFSLGSAIKYICRAGRKPGENTIRDLRKAVQNIEHVIEIFEKRSKEEQK